MSRESPFQPVTDLWADTRFSQATRTSTTVCCACNWSDTVSWWMFKLLGRYRNNNWTEIYQIKNRGKQLWWWYSNPKHVDGYHEQENIKWTKTKRGEIKIFKGFSVSGRSYSMSRYSILPKQHSPVLLCAVKITNLILCRDKICMKN